MGTMPFDDELERVLEPTGRTPAQEPFGGARVECQIARLGRIMRVVELPAELAAPQLRQPLHDPAHRLRIARWGSEVPGARRLLPLRERLGEAQIAAERAEHVLPRTHCTRVANVQRLAGLDRADG